MDTSDDRSLSPLGPRSRRSSGTSVTFPLGEDTAARHTLDTVQRLHAKLHDVASDNHKLDDSNAKLQRQLRDQLDRNVELQARLADAENAKRFAEQRLQESKRQSQAAYDQLEDQLIAAQTEKARVESDLALRDRQIITLQTQLDNKQRFLQELERTMLENHANFREQLARTLSTEPEGTKRYDESENVRKAFQESLDMLKQTFEERVSLLKQRHQLEQTVKHNADRDNQEEIMSLAHMDEITKLTQAFTKRTIALQESIHAFEALLQAKDNEIEELEDKAQQLEQELQGFRQNSQSVESTIATRLERLKEQYERDKHELQLNQTQLQADLQRLRDQLGQRTEERDDAKKQLFKLQSIVDNSKDEHDDQLASLRTQLRAATAELDRLRIDYDTVKIQLANQTEECGQLRQQKAMDELLSADHSSEAQRLKMDAAQARNEADIAVREKTQLQDRNRELSTRVAQLEKEKVDRLTKDDDSRQQVLDELKQEKASRTREQAAMLEEQQVLHDKIRSLEQKVDRLSTEKQALDEALRLAEQSRRQTEAAQILRLESELRTVRDTLEAERTRMAEEKAAVRQQLARLEDRYRRAAADNEAAFQRAEAFSRDLTTARETVRVQKDAIRDLEKRLAKADESEQVESLRDEILVLKTQLKYLQTSANRALSGNDEGSNAGVPSRTDGSKLHGIIDEMHDTFVSTVRKQQRTIEQLQTKGQRTYESSIEVDELAPIVLDMRTLLQKARSQVAWWDECITELGDKLAQSPSRAADQHVPDAASATTPPQPPSVDGTSSTISYRRVNEKAGVPLPSTNWSRGSSPQPTGITGSATRTTRVAADDSTPGRRSDARMVFESGENRHGDVRSKPAGLAWTAL